MTDLFEPIVSPPVAKPASKPASKIESARSTNVYKCWNGSRAPDSPTELSSPSLSDEETSASYKLFWDDDTLTNKDFHASGGFNYAAFGARDGSPDSGFESDGSATLVNPTAGSRGGWS